MSYVHAGKRARADVDDIAEFESDSAASPSAHNNKANATKKGTTSSPESADIDSDDDVFESKPRKQQQTKKQKQQQGSKSQQLPAAKRSKKNSNLADTTPLPNRCVSIRTPQIST